MKKMTFFLISGFAVFLSVVPVSAQESGVRKDFRFTVKTNPLSALGGPFWVTIVPVTGEYKALFEAKVAEKSSLQFGAAVLGPSVLINLDKITQDTADVSAGLKTRGFKFSVMYKYFLSRDLPAPKGFYVGAHTSFATARITSKNNSNNYVSAQKLNINAVLGYQLITTGGFTLDIFTGMGFVSRKWTYNGDSSGIFDLGTDRNSVSIPLGLNFGYAF